MEIADFLVPQEKTEAKTDNKADTKASAERSIVQFGSFADAAKAADALHVRMRNNTVPMEFAVAEDVSEDAGREVLEHRVLEDLIFRDNRFKDRAADVAKMIVGVKRQALTDDSPDKIAEAISQTLFNESIAETREQ